MFCDTGVSSATFGNLHGEMSTSANTSGMTFPKLINHHTKEKHLNFIMLSVILIPNKVLSDVNECLATAEQMQGVCRMVLHLIQKLQIVS